MNGERIIELDVFPTENNKPYFDLLVEEATITFDDDEYIIKKMSEKSIGKTYWKQITAIHKFYVDLINKQQPTIHNGSITFQNYMNLVFEDTPYTFVAIDFFPAREFENLGNDNRLALLQKGLDRFQAEFELVGNQVRFYKQIGNDTDFQFRYGHNIKAINVDIDTTNLATRIRGTGDPELGIEAEYTSPNSAIYGIIDAPPVNDERFKSEETLLEEMKRRLIDEPEISITVDFVDLRAAGYPYTVPNEGDRVWLIYEPMDDLMIETRILEINETFDSQGKVIKTEVTLSNHKKSFANTVFDNVRKQLRQIVNDDGIIRYSALDEAVKIATEALQSAQTELEFNNGIIAREKTDPNRLVVLNSAGLGISKDGGQTFQEAITADGFVLSVGAVGRLSANHIQIGPETLWENPNLALGTDEPKTKENTFFGILYPLSITPSDLRIGDKFILEFEAYVFDEELMIGIVNDPLFPDYIAPPVTIDTFGSYTFEIIVSNIPDGNNLYLVSENAYLVSAFGISNLTLKRADYAGETVPEWIDNKLLIDLRLESPLPTFISMNQDGITAYTPYEDSYARLDHRGLYIRNGAIEIDGDFGAPVMQGFNDISTQVKISAAGLTTYEAGLRTSLLDGSGHHFYWQNNYIGKIGTNHWIDDTSYRGLVFDLENEADYMTWAFKENPSDTAYTTMLAWHKTSAKENKGFTFYDDVTFNYAVTFSERFDMSDRGYVRSYTNAVEWGVRGTAYNITQFDSGQVQFHAGNATTAAHAFFPNGTKTGGSIEIDGITYGMSPIDSPQVLIEYIEFDVELSEIGTKVYIDKTFLKATENFAVFPNNGSIIEKGSDYFIVAGSGVADVRIVGKRVEYNRAFWADMESLPKPKEKSQKNNMMQISTLQSHKERVKENWFAEQIETRVEKVDGVNRKVIERLDVN